uniref:Cysteine proteinase inhibitor n=1 Tax=Oryza barthii TaxID=65489 RepID=A0A0D3FEF6_9ORYZ
MRQSSRLSIIVVVISVTLVAITNNADGAVASSPPPAEAAWTAVANVNDKSIQQVGQSAVRIYGLNTNKTYLRYVNVVSGQTQPYNGGYNYRLVVTVAGPGATTARYEAFMWGILGTTNWKLWQSSRLSVIVVIFSVTLVAITNNADGAVASSPPSVEAGWTAVANVNDKSIQQAGQYAVRIYERIQEIYLKYVNMVSGQMQPYNGGYNYRLVVTVVGPGRKTVLFDAYVWGIPGTINWRLRSFTPTIPFIPYGNMSSCLSIIVVVISVTLVAITNNADGALASSLPPAPAAWTAVANFGLWIYRQITRLYFLRYVSVVSGQTQPYNGGYNYRLVVTVYGGPNWKTTLYDADVWGIPGTTTHWWFRSFTPKRS